MKPLFPSLSLTLFFLLLGLWCPTQNIVGTWKLTDATFNNAPIAGLSSTLVITDVDANDSLNYLATFDNGTHSGVARARYTLNGNTFVSNLNDAPILLNGFSFSFTNGPNGLVYSWSTSLNISNTAFNQWGGTAIGFGSPTVSSDGFEMTLTSANGNTVLTYENQNPVSASTLTERPAAALRVFPNPADDRALVQTEHLSGPASLTLFDASGRQVWQSRRRLQPSGSFELGVAALPAGVYFLRVSSAETSAQQIIYVQ